MRTRTVKVVLGVLVVGLLAACGGSSKAKVTVEATPAALRQSAQRSLDQGTVHVKMTMDMTVEGRSLALTADGAMDPARKLLQMSMDMSSMLEGLASDGQVPDDVRSAFSEPLTMVLSGTTMYMRFPALAGLLGAGGKEWIKADLSSTNPALGSLLGGDSTFGTDPTKLLELLQGAGKVTEVGKEDVDGTSTTHFSGAYSTDDAMAALTEDQRSAMSDALSQMSVPDGFGAKEMPFDVWIDGGGLVRRMKMSMDFGGLVSGASAGFTATIDFSDYGKAVDITVPSDDQVTDISSLVPEQKFSSVGSAIN